MGDYIVCLKQESNVKRMFKAESGKLNATSGYWVSKASHKGKVVDIFTLKQDIKVYC